MAGKNEDGKEKEKLYFIKFLTIKLINKYDSSTTYYVTLIYLNVKWILKGVHENIAIFKNLCVHLPHPFYLLFLF